MDGAAAGTAVGGALLDGPKDTSRASTGAVQVQVQVKAPKSGQIQDSFEDENTPSLEAVRGVCLDQLLLLRDGVWCGALLGEGWAFMCVRFAICPLWFFC